MEHIDKMQLKINKLEDELEEIKIQLRKHNIVIHPLIKVYVEYQSWRDDKNKSVDFAIREPLGKENFHDPNMISFYVKIIGREKASHCDTINVDVEAKASYPEKASYKAETNEECKQTDYLERIIYHCVKAVGRCDGFPFLSTCDHNRIIKITIEDKNTKYDIKIVN